MQAVSKESHRLHWPGATLCSPFWPKNCARDRSDDGRVVFFLRRPKGKMSVGSGRAYTALYIPVSPLLKLILVSFKGWPFPPVNFASRYNQGQANNTGSFHGLHGCLSCHHWLTLLMGLRYPAIPGNTRPQFTVWTFPPDSVHWTHTMAVSPFHASLVVHCHSRGQSAHSPRHDGYARFALMMLPTSDPWLLPVDVMGRQVLIIDGASEAGVSGGLPVQHLALTCGITPVILYSTSLLEVMLDNILLFRVI